jgi:hypothetical protein
MTRVISYDIISVISSPMLDFNIAKYDSFSRLYKGNGLEAFTYTIQDNGDLVGFKS